VAIRETLQADAVAASTTISVDTSRALRAGRSRRRRRQPVRAWQNLVFLSPCEARLSNGKGLPALYRAFSARPNGPRAGCFALARLVCS